MPAAHLTPAVDVFGRHHHLFCRRIARPYAAIVVAITRLEPAQLAVKSAVRATSGTILQDVAARPLLRRHTSSNSSQRTNACSQADDPCHTPRISFPHLLSVRIELLTILLIYTCLNIVCVLWLILVLISILSECATCKTYESQIRSDTTGHASLVNER